jgi:amino acid adenylation domain-containing protein
MNSEIAIENAPGAALATGPVVVDPSLPFRRSWAGSILDRLRDHVDLQGCAICAAAPDCQVTFEELDAASDRLAERIVRHWSSAEGVVSIYGDRSPRLSVALVGAMKAGLAFQIIDPRYPPQRIVEYVKYVRPVGILNASLDLRAVSDLLGMCRTNREASCIAVEEVLRPTFPELLRARQKAGTPLGPDTPMYVAFTSGTSGVPKAVWGSHGPISHFFQWQQRRFGIGQDDRVSVLSGLAHDPLLRDVLMPIWTGSSAWFPPDDVYRIPGLLYAWLRDARVSVIHLTASLCNLLLNIPKSESQPQLNKLRLAFFGGEVLPLKLAERFRRLAPNCQIVNCYGATETPQVMAFHVFVPGENPASHSDGECMSVPIGRGIDGVQIVLLDQALQLCTPGVAGELFVRTPYRATHIEDIHEQPADSFIQNPFTADPSDLLYRTGDYGKYLEDGTVIFLGRRDRQIKIRGYRIDLNEVEPFVQELKGISYHHLEPVNLKGELRLALFVVPQPGEKLQVEAIRDSLSRQMPFFMVPERIVILPTLPQTPNGKVDTQRLQEMLAIEPEAVANASSKLLRDQGSISDRVRASLRSFTTDGEELEYMDSLRIVEVCCLLEDEFGLRISVETLQQFQTVAEIVAHLEQFLESTDAEPGETRREVKGRRAFADDVFRGSFHDRPKGLRWLPRNERVWNAFGNRILQILARVAPETLRLCFHRWRGVELGRDVSIGYDTIIETAFPWLVRIGNDVSIGMRVTIIGHFRGMELLANSDATVVIDDSAFVGPGAIILPNVTIGKGAVVAAGSVVSANVPPFRFVQGNPARVVARCERPLAGKTSYAEFLNHLIPVSANPSKCSPVNERVVELP